MILVFSRLSRVIKMAVLILFTGITTCHATDKALTSGQNPDESASYTKKSGDINLYPLKPVSVKNEQSQASIVETQAISAHPSRRSGIYGGGPPRVYTGERIGVNFFDTDIRNIFRLIADFSGKNFAIDKDVHGKVTLAIDKPVPWDQVLDLVLRMNQLEKIQEGEIIRIARLETLKLEEKAKQELFEAEKKAKTQSLELEPVATEYIPVHYAKAKEEMMQHVAKMISPNRNDCNITVDERTNQLIVTDTAAKIKQIKNVVQKLDRVTPQVVIEAKIVEATNDFSRELGLGWSVEGTFPGSGGTYGYSGVGLYPGAVNFPLSTPTGGLLGFSFSRIAGTSLLIDATLNAMEINKKGKIISAPKILTLDNKEAYIEQGLEIGYLERTKTDELPTTKFKKVTLNLKVTPHITLDNRVTLKIEISKDDIHSFTATGVPTISTKKATTELLVDDGDTLVIGGITKTSQKETETGIPFLSKVPVLGWLFKVEADKQDNEELLIFMTPRIVQLEQRATKVNISGQS